MINRKGGEERREREGEEKRENKKLCRSSSNVLEERKQEKYKQTHKT